MRYIRPTVSLLVLSCSFASSSSLDKDRLGFLETVLSPSSFKSADQQYCKPTGQIQDACCDFETVESVNQDLFKGLQSLVATPYFRYHKVDLYKECPFWQEQGSCMNRACGVETTDEDHLPEEWRSYTLGKLNHQNDSKTASPVGCQEIKDSEFCVLEDELDSEGVYVDLIENPERFTGYAGASSTRVWKAIYEENCFTPVPFIDPARPSGFEGFASLSSSPFSSSSSSGGLSSSGLSSGLSQGSWGESEKRLVNSLAGPRDGGEEEVCLEKRVFYRLISGLHASISSHICDDYLDQKTGQWSPNLDCFITRIGQHPERLENMYFTYVLLLRAFSRSGPLLLKTLEETSPTKGDVGDGTRERLEELIKVANGCPSTFDETSMFAGGHEAQILKTEFKQHFRNVSLIMDCVGCDKCRLWGKMQITGLGTALKLLFSQPEELSPSNDGVVLSRSEAVAFINTLHRLSESLAAVDKFRELWARRGEMEKREEEGTMIDAKKEEEEAQDSNSVSSPSSSPVSSSTPEPILEEEEEEEEDSTTPLDNLDSIPSYEHDSTAETTTTTNNFVGNLTTLPLSCARAIWTKLVDLCEITGLSSWRRGGGNGGVFRGEL